MAFADHIAALRQAWWAYPKCAANLLEMQAKRAANFLDVLNYNRVHARAGGKGE